jgi:dihydroflavonol-4-reductase
MTVVVTGAAGHIGGNLVRALLSRGRRVRAIVHEDDAAVRGLPIEIRSADVCDEAAISDAIAGAEVVFHLAARISIIGDPDGKVRRTNVEGPRNVVRACQRHKVRRLIHFSSIHALSQQPLDLPIDENRAASDHPRLPAYDRSKAAGEREVLAGVSQGLDAVILNPLGVIGPHDYRPSRMGEVLINLYHRKVPMSIAGGFNWVDVRDVVDGALAAEERGRRGERYLLGGHYLTISELSDLASSITGVPAPRLCAPMWLARVGAPFVEIFSKVTGQRPLYTGEALEALRGNREVRYDKARRELGYSPRPIRDTIESTYAWFRENGRI